MNACLPRLEELLFNTYSIGPQGMPVLAALLEGDALPSLKDLKLTSGPGIEDDDVLRLAHSLLASPRTRLTKFHPMVVGMGDIGMAAVANLVRQGCLRTLKVLSLSGSRVTDEGVFALVEAISQGPVWDMLEYLSLGPLGSITNVGAGAMAYAVIHKCPSLQSLSLGGKRVTTDAREAVVGMLRAAGIHSRLNLMWLVYTQPTTYDQDEVDDLSEEDEVAAAFDAGEY